MRKTPTRDPRRKNVTRRNRSIPRDLIRRGALHLLPLYYVLRLSDLGQEGIDHSGSYRFADHLYRNVPSGRMALGRLIDATLLRLRAARAFRRRYEQAQRTVRVALESRPADATPLRVLAVPCGLPRDIADLARGVHGDVPGLLSRLEYHGMDVDPEVLEMASRLTAQCGVSSARYYCGDALTRSDYPRLTFHLVISTGLGEFLTDAELAAFFGHVHDVLEPGGTFFTSATRRDARSDLLLRLGEITATYREPHDLERILVSSRWTRLELKSDPSGLQTFATAVK